MATHSLARLCILVVSIATVNADACNDNNHCHNNGVCYHENNQDHCNCVNTNYVGSTCQYKKCSSNSYKECHNNGACYIADDGRHKCLCADFRFGEHCQFRTCDSSFCHDQGTCYYDQHQHRRCSCSEGYTGTHCGLNAATTTTTSTTTTTRTTTPSTTTQYIGYLHCNKYSTVADLAHTAPVTNQNASECVHSQSHASSKALVMHDCEVNSLDTWQKGQKIIGNCASIPAYTAIGTFFIDAFQTGQGLAGVFLECLPNGFKVAIQTCDNSPKLMHIEAGGVGLLDPEIYFTIQ